jgi:YVTN family beta-propeller protein
MVVPLGITIPHSANYAVSSVSPATSASVAKAKVTPHTGCTNCVIGSVPTGTYPDNAVVDSTTGDIYIMNSGTSNVTVYDPSMTYMATINVGNGPVGGCFDPSNGYVYIANSEADNVSVIDGSTVSHLTDFSVGTDYGPEPTPYGCAYDPLTNEVYVADNDAEMEGSAVWIVSTTTGIVSQDIRAGAGVHDITYYPHSEEMFATNSDDTNVTIINASTDTKTTAVPAGGYPQESTLCPNGDIYTSTASGAVGIINGKTNAFVGDISIAGSSSIFGVACDTKTGYVYVVDPSVSLMFVINSESNTLYTYFAIPWPSLCVNYDPLNGVIYANHYGGHNE